MRRLPKLEGEIKLDIGCGKFKKDGFIGVDAKDFGQEIVWDICQGLPFQDETVDEVYTSHTLEHIKDESLDDLFREFHRVCKNGAKLTIRVPHADTIEAHYFCHHSFWSENKIKGMVKDSFGRLEIEEIKRDGIHLIVILKICH